ncbi:unnamed protein product, partial [Meganyctiphanes norvegica]
NSTSAELPHNYFNNMIYKEVPLNFQANITLHGTSIPEDTVYNTAYYSQYNNIVYENQMGPQITHVFNIINNGPSDLKDAILWIYWPHQSKNGNYLLYLLEQPKSYNCKCSYISEVNPLGIQVKKRYKNNIFEHKMDKDNASLEGLPRTLKKDDIENSYQQTYTSSYIPFTSQNEVLSEDGDCSEYICTIIRCEVESLQVGHDANIYVRSRLFVNSMTENSANLYSKLVVEVNEGQNKTKVVRLDVITLASLKAIPNAAPVWLIALAVCAGLLIEAVIAALLWKLEYFKRKRPDYQAFKNFKSSLTRKPDISKPKQVSERHPTHSASNEDFRSFSAINMTGSASQKEIMDDPVFELTSDISHSNKQLSQQVSVENLKSSTLKNSVILRDQQKVLDGPIYEFTSNISHPNKPTVYNKIKDFIPSQCSVRPKITFNTDKVFQNGLKENQKEVLDEPIYEFASNISHPNEPSVYNKIKGFIPSQSSLIPKITFNADKVFQNGLKENQKEVLDEPIYEFTSNISHPSKPTVYNKIKGF